MRYMVNVQSESNPGGLRFHHVADFSSATSRTKVRETSLKPGDFPLFRLLSKLSLTESTAISALSVPVS